MAPIIGGFYLDPAAGSLAFQILIGSFFAMAAMFRRHLGRVALWRRFRK
jgi:hypothetical protein